ncbi:MAG TPA: class I SAM-dependent methyltransferase [Terriglobales bacterium]|nr:class I SAM-dependent methyltransferase [Terriglobales bacterium]
MAADYKQMLQNIKEFYSFHGKKVLAVGAGNGPLTDLVLESKKLIVIDKEPVAIRFWETKVSAEELQDRVQVIHADFCEASPRGDVVYFEFCLHEMNDPAQALRHALTLAPEVLVFDHLPDSEWAFHAAEEDKVRRSTNALADFACTRHHEFRTEQRFPEYRQLVDKVSPQGKVALERAERYRGAVDIAIPMTYGLTLLDREANLSTTESVDVKKSIQQEHASRTHKN